MTVISLDNPVIRSYIFYSTLLALKLLMMSFLTTVTRLAKGVFANPEDAITHPKGKVKFDDPQVERVRRAHLNDLENIPAFWVIGLLYATTNPSVALATVLYRVYTAGRMLHTVVYALVPLRQPARVIAFGIPMLILFYMGFNILFHYATAL